MKKLFLTFLLTTQAYSQELTLYVIPSQGLDWSTPKNLLFSAVKNKLSFKPHSMGHLWMEVKCGNETELSGMTGDNPDFINQLVFKERGFGVFYHSFSGKMEEKENVTSEKEKYLNNNGMNFIRFTLNEGQCKRALQYLSEFRKNNVGRHYGLAHRPRHAEGASSSAFAVSFPDVLNILDQEMKETWIDQVKIPLELAGPPVREESVSIFKVMNKDKWATDQEKHQTLRFWNPDKIYNWINEKVKLKKTGYSVLQIKKVSGVVFDKSHFPVPLEPIWLQQIDPKDKSKTAIFVLPSRPPKNNFRKE